MPWYRTDDDLPEHVKADALESAAGDPATLAAAWMTWLHMGCDCARRRTDGAFTRARAHRAVRLPSAMVDAGIAALVSARFFDATDDGYQFHNWSKYQPTKAESEADRQANAERQKAFRNRHRNGVTNAVTNGVTNGVTNAPVTPGVTASVTTPLPVPSLPVPSLPVSTEEGEESPERAEHAAATATVRPSPKGKAPKTSDAPETPPVDPVARAVFDAIVADPMLAPITRRPADLATRLVAPGAFPGVNVLGQVLRAAAWNAGQRKPKRDGRAFLLGWLGRSDPEAPTLPTHAPPVAVEEHDPIEIARQEYRSRLGLAVAS